MHYRGLRLMLRPFRTSPSNSVYAEASELSINYKTDESNMKPI